MTDIATRDFRIAAPTAPMKAEPSVRATCTNECLHGEIVRTIPTTIVAAQTVAHKTDSSLNQMKHADEEEQWLHVIAQRDGYSGYVELKHLQELDGNFCATTHRVCAMSTLVFSDASIKSPVVERLPFLAHVSTTGIAKGELVQLDSGAFIWAQHLHKINEPMQVDPIELARTHFLGAPYLWGGCSPQGVDCSGLVQALASAKGITIERDSKDQERTLSVDIAYEHRQAADLVYWPGHTGILIDPDTLLHATAHSLNCVVEPLQNVVQRAGTISGIKRLFD